MTTILFDADGVLQRSALQWVSAFGDLLPDDEDADQFMSSFLQIERGYLVNDGDLRTALRPVLRAFGIEDSIDEIFEITCRIDVVEDAMSLIGELRRQGFRCGLASNQSPIRARYMSTQLQFAEQFDVEFYSCHLGVMKPNTSYFEAILERLGEPADSVLFIDDKQENVTAALACGLRSCRYHLDSGPHRLRSAVADLIGEPPALSTVHD